SKVVSDIGLKNTIELYSFRPGFEAKNINRFADAVRRAHRATFGEDPRPAQVETSSMWRDINAFNEVGVPALTYGPRSTSHSFKRALSIDSLYQAACAYARIAVDVCSEEKVHPAGSMLVRDDVAFSGMLGDPHIAPNALAWLKGIKGAF